MILDWGSRRTMLPRRVYLTMNFCPEEFLTQAYRLMLRACAERPSLEYFSLRLYNSAIMSAWTFREC